MGVTFVVVKLWVLILLSFFSVSVKATSTPVPGVANFCVQLSRWPYYYLYWTPLLFLEALLFSLALYKGYECCRNEDKSTAHLSRTMNFLVKGSVWYFLTIFSVYTANTIVANIQHNRLQPVPEVFSVALSSIMSQRLILSVRSRLGNTVQCSTEMVEPAVDDFRLLTMHFEEPSMQMGFAVSDTPCAHTCNLRERRSSSSSSGSRKQWLAGVDTTNWDYDGEDLRGTTSTQHSSFDG